MSGGICAAMMVFLWQGGVPCMRRSGDLIIPFSPSSLGLCGCVVRFGVEFPVYQRGYVVRVIPVMVRGGACLRCAVLNKACEIRGPVSPISRIPFPRGGRCVVMPGEGKVARQRARAFAGRAWDTFVPAAPHSPRPRDYLVHVKVGVFNCKRRNGCS